MMGLLCFVYLVCSIRTNLIFFLIFFTLVPAFMLLAGSYFKVASGDANMGKKLAEASGAFCFVTCCCGWYIFFAIMLASVDFPLDLPRKFFCSDHTAIFARLLTKAVVDLSHIVKGASEKRKINHVE